MNRRLISTLCQFGWEARDPRCASGFSLGASLLDGNYKTVWEHLDVCVRVALVSSLSFLKGTGGEANLPRGLMTPFTSDGRFMMKFAQDSIKASMNASLNLDSADNPSMTIFSRKYDLICPLPSSKGPASKSNLAVAQIIASAINDNVSSANLMHLIQRFQPMACKSTKEDRNIRRSRDAPRIMHYDNMRLDPEILKDGFIKGKSILLYDDVFHWGNTSEAARNLLLMAGADEVDVLACFCTGDSFRSSFYERINDLSNKESFKLQKSSVITKEHLSWIGQANMKEWHQNIKEYINSDFPEFVPNDIPWV